MDRPSLNFNHRHAWPDTNTCAELCTHGRTYADHGLCHFGEQLTEIPDPDCHGEKLAPSASGPTPLQSSACFDSTHPAQHASVKYTAPPTRSVSSSGCWSSNFRASGRRRSRVPLPDPGSQCSFRRLRGLPGMCLACRWAAFFVVIPQLTVAAAVQAGTFASGSLSDTKLRIVSVCRLCMGLLVFSLSPGVGDGNLRSELGNSKQPPSGAACFHPPMWNARSQGSQGSHAKCKHGCSDVPHSLRCSGLAPSHLCIPSAKWDRQHPLLVCPDSGCFRLCLTLPSWMCSWP